MDTKDELIDQSGFEIIRMQELIKDLEVACLIDINLYNKMDEALCELSDALGFLYGYG